MKLIPLSKGAFAMVDDEDYERLSQWKWFYLNNGYVGRNGKVTNGIRQKSALMHRELMSEPEGVSVDHANGNRLDNRKSNLRLATRAQQGMNKSVSSNNKLGLKGVSFDQSRGKFTARITVSPKYVYLGRFDTAQEAKSEYDAAALKCYGEFARF